MENEEVMNIALDWVEAMETTSDPASLRPKLDTWLQEDPNNLPAYQAARIQWAKICNAVTVLERRGPAAADGLLREIDAAGCRIERQRQKLRRARVGVAAAAVAACMGGVGFFWVGRSPPTSWTHYSGTDGIPQTHLLADGSELRLDHDSEVSVRMTKAAREIVLKKGELLVHVRHRGDRSFLVRAGMYVIEAKGTEFSVRRDSKGGLDTSVREGRVEVSSDAVSPLSQPRSVVAGQIATISNGQFVVKQDPEEIENRLAWVHGELYLHGTLAQAVAQFNDHNETQLVIADPSIGNMSVIGFYKLHDVSEFVESLRSRGVMSRTRKAPGSTKETIILSGDKPPRARRADRNDAH